MSEGRNSMLAPLRSARDSLATLRAGAADAETTRAATARVAEAAEATLRRMLRDDEDAPLPLRLGALAPDEFPAEAVVSELRQRDRISIELAAAFHDLLRVRRRPAAAPAVPSDAEVALRVAEQIEREVTTPRPSSPLPPLPDPTAPAAGSESGPPVHPVPPDSSVDGRQPRGPWVAGGAAALVLLLVVAWMAGGWPGTDAAEIDEAVALFRSGDMAAAAPLFLSYAEAHPDDATPRLYLARIYRRAGRFGEAQDQLRQALTTAPEDPGLQRELGFLLLDADQSEAATERFRTAIELDPESPQGWIGLVRALRESGRTDAAVRVLARAPAEVRALVQQQSP